MSDFDRNYSGARSGPFSRSLGQADAAAVDACLRAYMLRIYNFMVIGLGSTGLASLGVYMAAVQNTATGAAAKIGSAGRCDGEIQRNSAECERSDYRYDIPFRWHLSPLYYVSKYSERYAYAAPDIAKSAIVRHSKSSMPVLLLCGRATFPCHHLAFGPGLIFDAIRSRQPRFPLPVLLLIDLPRTAAHPRFERFQKHPRRHDTELLRLEPIFSSTAAFAGVRRR